MSFTSLGLPDAILKAVSEAGYETPTPIQQQAIPAILTGKDVMAAAQTGTGKTAGFTLPLLARLAEGQPAKSNQARALVLTPTRELAAQVAESVATYGKHLPLRSHVVFGGVNINPQMMKLRKGADILIATPGRLLDLYQQNAVRFNHLEVLVLDEADRMLDMGFIHDIKRILALLPKRRQNLLFSATFSDEIRKLASGLVNQAVEISVSPPNAAANTVKQWLVPVDKKRKPQLLRHLLDQNPWEQVLVFTKTKHGANKLTQFLEAAGFKAAAIHGNKSQGARTRALSEFKQGIIRVLVATDIAARGLDIDQLPCVVNLDLPNVAEDYVHRIGRTGRAGATGQAISLVSHDEHEQLVGIERLTRKHIPREYVDGFDPEHDIPASRPLNQPVKPNRPKRQGPPAGNNRPNKPAHARGNAQGNGPRPAGERTQGQRPAGQRPAGDRPSGQQKPEGQRPAGRRNGRPRRPQGGRPQGNRPQN